MANENDTQLIETKLTKTEAIELLVSEMKNELESKRSKLGAERDALAGSFTIDDFPMFKYGKFSISKEYGNRNIFSVSFASKVNLSDLPAEVVRKVTRLRELEDEIERLGKQSYELDNGNKAKLTILKTMLEGSEEGKRFLQLLDGLKLKVSPKLLGSGR